MSTHRCNKMRVPFYRRRCIWAIAAVLLTTVFGFLHIHGYLARERLERRIHRYVLDGEPVRAAQLAHFFNAGTDNGTEVRRFTEALSGRGKYLSGRAFAFESKGLPFLDRAWPLSAVWPENSFRKAEAYCTAHEPWFATLSELSHAEQSVWVDHRSIEHYAALRLEHVNVLAHGVCCLCLKGAVRVRQGRMDEAIDALRQAKSVNRHLLREPFSFNVVSALAGERAIQIVAEQAAFSKTALTTDQQEQLQRVCVPFGEDLLRRSIIVERLAGLDYYHQRSVRGSSHDPHSFSYLRLLPLSIACAKIEQYLDVIDCAAAVFDLPSHRWIPVAEELVMRQCQHLHRGNPLLALAPPISLFIGGYVRYCDNARRIRAAITEQDRSAALIVRGPQPPQNR